MNSRQIIVVTAQFQLLRPMLMQLALGLHVIASMPEIRQGLSSMANGSVGLTFVPHLVPMNRGIHATLYARLKSDVDFQSLSEKTYASEFFVDLLPAKFHPEKRSFRSAITRRIAVHRPQGVILW